jgi:Kef-type K+ transport system membrane component KefB
MVAVAGKMGGAVIGGRWTGLPWRDSWALGALLNTRGLVELIVVKIAYSAHVFSPALFTMLVIMALLTTIMTTPILNLLKVGQQSIKSREISGIGMV